MSHLKSPSTWISLLALALTLTGTAMAAGLITGAQVKNSSLTGADIKNGTITRKDLKSGTIPTAIKGDTGPQGPAGPAGPTGPAGGATTALSGAAFDPYGSLSGSPAVIGEDGDIDVATSATFNVTAAVSLQNSSGTAKTVTCEIDYPVTNTKLFKTISSPMTATIPGGSPGSATIAMTGSIAFTTGTYDPLVRCSGSSSVTVPAGDISVLVST